MTADSLYLDNIDEFVNDENKIVTYRWLSLTLQVHCNLAKQMLYKFVEDQRKVKDSDNLTVTYFVSGLSKSRKDEYEMFKFAVVPEDRLEGYKSSLAVVTSCHIYSVQRLKLKDSNGLYMTDLEKFNEDVFQSNKHSAIQYGKASLRAKDEIDLLKGDLTPVVTTKTEPQKPSGAPSGRSAAAKKGPQAGIAGMFAKQDKKQAPQVKQDKKTEVKKEDKKSETKTEVGKAAGKKAAGKMSSFFSKQTGDKKPESAKEKVSPAKKQADQEKGKKTQRVPDSDEEEVKTKRRRTKDDLFASSSEEEEEEEEEEAMEVEPESTVPAFRVPTPEPEPKSRSPAPDVAVIEEIEEEEPVPRKTWTATEKGGEKVGERRRKRIRKLVPKTYMDDDGFMVTEKVYESESTDASEVEEPVKTSKASTKPSKVSPKDTKKGSPQKKSPSKKAATQQTVAKQRSLMSFFKKS